MGSYGIGITRLIGVLVEKFSDEKGIIWPESVSPFQVHLISLGEKESPAFKEAERTYERLSDTGISVLLDDREARAGEKFADADLIGIPVRVVVSEKTMALGKFEVKKRSEDSSSHHTEKELLSMLNKKHV